MNEVRSTESAIISSYPTSVCGMIVLLSTKHWIKKSRFVNTAGFEFRGQFPYLDKLQNIEEYKEEN